VVSFLGRDDGGVGHQREMDSWIGHQVGLELVQVDIESSVKSEGSSDGGYHLSDEPVQVGVARSLNVQVSSADVVDSLVVDHEGTVRVLEGGMGSEDGVVGFNNSRGDLRSRVDSKLEFTLLSVINTQSLKEKRCEPRSGSSTEGVEDEESLKTGTLVSQFPDPIQTKIDDLLSDGVVTSSVVIGGIFLSSDELFRMEELSVGSSPYFINNSWLQVQEHSSRNVFSSSSLAEEGVEGVITTSDSLVRGHLTIRLDTVFQAVEFPTSITDLNSGLTEMDRDTLTHGLAEI